ncbi:kelch repeat-containing protein [Pyxidicoccus sp. 3LFB2]
MLEPEGPSLFLELRTLTGLAVPGAEVRLTSGQRLTASEEGTVLLEKVAAGPQLLQVRAEGFSSSFLAVNLPEGVRAGAHLTLQPLESLGTFDPSKEARLERDGISITVPPNSLYDAQGQPIQGEVEAFMSSLNLEEGELLAAPGVLQGMTQAGPVGLESVGMVSLSFRHSAGLVVSSARSVGVGGRGPGSIRVGSEGLPRGTLESAKQAPADDCPLTRLPAWRWDPVSMLWKPTGDLGHFEPSGSEEYPCDWQVVVDNMPDGVILHLALPFWWRSPSASADNPLQPTDPAWVETSCLEAQVEDSAGKPVAGLTVVALGKGYSGVSLALTDKSGRALLEVMRNQTVTLEAGGGPQEVFTGEGAGTCDGKGVNPQAVRLVVPVRRCTAGSARECLYSGPPGTMGQGICRAARQSCNANGTAWSTGCLGQVLPQAQENCANPHDDNCDGSINEDCPTVCSEKDSPRSCYTGQAGTQAVGLCKAGTQTCVAGGKAWSECEGQVLPEEAEDCPNPGDEDCARRTCQLCRKGETEMCAYTGAAGTEGVGPCHAGTRTCNAQGTGWDACQGEVLPLPAEDCTTPEDDDCDGLANEGDVCLCEPDTSEPCYTGPAGTQGIGQCLAGTRSCNAEGTGWGACVNEVRPRPELCGNGLDDNCNNQLDDCSWTAASTMDSGRFRHKIQLLANDKALVTGGTSSSSTSSILATAEEYDPSSGIWSPTGSMTTARQNHTMTLLGNGKVLVAGGENSDGAHASAEEYDLVARQWMGTGAMGTARVASAATVLRNGQVLISGGRDAVGGFLASAELYDPVTRSWSSTGAMTVPRENHTMTLLSSGKVLVAGGRSPAGFLTSAEEYDPATGVWAAVGSMATSRTLHAAAALDNGKVLVAGGENDEFLASAEEYDPVTQTWSNTGQMSAARTNYAAVRLRNGWVLAIGGYGAFNAEVYDPAQRAWFPTFNMTGTRGEHAAVQLKDDRVLVCGGFRGGTGALNSSELYTP